MTTDNPVRFAELLISRLCHDLIAPMGAVGTGLELFQEMVPLSPENQEIFNLVQASSKSASLRISLFRAAFSAGGNSLAPKETQALLEAYFESTKINFHWDTPSEAPFNGWSRLVVNAVLCLSECAPRGGMLSIKPMKNSFFSVCLKADSIVLQPGMEEALKGLSTVQDLSPRTVPCYLLSCLLQEKGAECHFNHSSPSELVLEVRKNIGER